MKRLKTTQKKLFSKYKAVIGQQDSTLNVIKQTRRLYSFLTKANEDALLEIAKESYLAANPEAKKLPDKKWLLAFLLGYNPVTKYVYEHEVERKRARLAEAIISVGATQQEFTTASNLFWRQTAQYGIDVTDASTLKAYKDMGIEKVRWKTEEDNRVCKTCKDRNNKIYPIDNIPSKPHYGCRCWYEAVREGE